MKNFLTVVMVLAGIVLGSVSAQAQDCANGQCSLTPAGRPLAVARASSKGRGGIFSLRSLRGSLRGFRVCRNGSCR